MFEMALRQAQGPETLRSLSLSKGILFNRDPWPMRGNPVILAFF